VILVYDVTNRESFNSIGHWIADAKARVHPQASCLLIGNKGSFLLLFLHSDVFVSFRDDPLCRFAQLTLKSNGMCRSSKVPDLPKKMVSDFLPIPPFL
jgi:hypothetical protein